MWCRWSGARTTAGNGSIGKQIFLRQNQVPASNGLHSVQNGEEFEICVLYETVSYHSPDCIIISLNVEYCNFHKTSSYGSINSMMD